MVPYSKYTIKDNDTPEHEQVALELARQSLVLLNNNGILPLDQAKIKRIAVIGPNGNSTSMLHGNYHGSASHPVSILSGIKQLVIEHRSHVCIGMSGHHQTRDGCVERPR